MRKLKNFFQWKKQGFSKEQLVEQSNVAIILVGIGCATFMMLMGLSMYIGYLKISIPIFAGAVIFSLVGYIYMAKIFNELESRNK